jgi:hypothetical protein
MAQQSVSAQMVSAGETDKHDANKMLCSSSFVAIQRACTLAGL